MNEHLWTATQAKKKRITSTLKSLTYFPWWIHSLLPNL